VRWRTAADGDARCAAAEARIYRERLHEHYARDRLRGGSSADGADDHRARWKGYLAAVDDLVKPVSGTEREVAVLHRAIDLGLAACHFLGAMPGPSVKGLQELSHAMANADGATDENRAAARAAARIAEVERFAARAAGPTPGGPANSPRRSTPRFACFRCTRRRRP